MTDAPIDRREGAQNRNGVQTRRAMIGRGPALPLVLSLALLLAIGLAGCANLGGQPREEAAPTQSIAGTKIAVLPFENLTNYPNAGRIAADLFGTELYNRDLFKLQEETETRRALAELNINPDDLASVAGAQQAAELLEVDAVLIGSVSEFGYQQGLREEPVVGVNARLVRRKDGAVLWAASHSELGGGYLQRGSLNATAQVVIRRMVESLAEASR